MPAGVFVTNLVRKRARVDVRELDSAALGAAECLLRKHDHVVGLAVGANVALGNLADVIALVEHVRLHAIALIAHAVDNAHFVLLVIDDEVVHVRIHSVSR